MNSSLSDDGRDLDHGGEMHLVRRMRQGETAAIDEFCSVYLGKLYRYAVRRMDRPEDAEEVVQTVIANAARRIDTFRGDASLFAWLISICRREMYRHGAAARRHALVVSMDGDPDADPVSALAARLRAPRGLDPDMATQQREVSDLIWECLDRMPERQAQALVLKYVEGHSARDIAATLGASDEATQSLLARARRTFREVCNETLQETLREAFEDGG